MYHSAQVQRRSDYHHRDLVLGVYSKVRRAGTFPEVIDANNYLVTKLCCTHLRRNPYTWQSSCYSKLGISGGRKRYLNHNFAGKGGRLASAKVRSSAAVAASRLIDDDTDARSKELDAPVVD